MNRQGKLKYNTKCIMIHNGVCELCCVWCKIVLPIYRLTIEHIKRDADHKKGETRKHLALSCEPCNALHGSIMNVFQGFCQEAITTTSYSRALKKLAQRHNYYTIINHGQFQISIEPFKDYPNYRYNPSRISVQLPTNKVVAQIIDRELTYMVFSKAQSPLALWGSRGTPPLCAT